MFTKNKLALSMLISAFLTPITNADNYPQEDGKTKETPEHIVFFDIGFINGDVIGNRSIRIGYGRLLNQWQMNLSIQKANEYNNKNNMQYSATMQYHLFNHLSPYTGFVIHDDAYGLQDVFGIASNWDLTPDWSLFAYFERKGQFSKPLYTNNQFGFGLNYHFRTDVYSAKKTSIVKPKPCKVVRENLDVKFQHDSSIVEPAYYYQIEKIANILKETNATLVIEGHTSVAGSDDYNLKLSQKRADAIVDVLVNEFGVDRGRLTPIGYGESRPAVDPSLPDAAKYNRRVVAEISYFDREHGNCDFSSVEAEKQHID
jgi:outer membrane protein OmpA-like peptidoglycan-associated protein